MKKLFLTLITAAFLFCSFATICSAQDFNPTQSGNGVILVGDHTNFSLKSPICAEGDVISGMADEMVLVFKFGEGKVRQLNLSNTDQYENFKSFCQERGYKVNFKFSKMEDEAQILIIKVQ